MYENNEVLTENQDLWAENERLRQEIAMLKAQNNCLPSWHRMRGTPSKVTIYTTKEAFELYNKAVQWVADEYGCKKCYASAFVLEEALKRVGFPQEDNV